MPRTDLVSLVIRLGLAFVVLVIIGFIIFARVRRSSTDVAHEPGTPTPTTSPTAQPPVTIITPTPTPTVEPPLPTVDSRNGDQREGKSKGGEAPQKRTTTRRVIIIERRTISVDDTTAATAVSQDGRARASASASGSSASASASAASW